MVQGHLVIYTYANISAEDKDRSRKELQILLSEECDGDGVILEF